MPIGSLYIQNFVFLVSLELINKFDERSFDLEKYAYNLWGSGSSELRKLVVSAFQSELKLSLANFNQFWTSLDKGFNWCEDWVGTELPFSIFCTINDFNELIINLSPFFSAFDGIIKVFNAFLNISVKHIINIDIGLTSLNDLVRDFIKKSWNSFIWLVELGMMPDHSYSFQQLRNHLRNVLWDGSFKPFAGLEQRFQEKKIVLCFLWLAFDVSCELAESSCVIAIHLFQKLDDSLKLSIFKLLIDVFQVLSSVSPVLNLIQRSWIFILLMWIRIAYNFLNLSIPLNNGSLQSLD